MPIQQKTLKAALEAIANKYGRLTAESVIDEARDKKHPLHAHFDWDDKSAGQQWRVQQARKLIASVTVVIRTETRTLEVPYYVRDPEAPSHTQGYVSLPALQTDEDIARDAVVAEFSRASSSLRRARDLASALQLEESIDEILASIDSVRAVAVGESRDGASA